MKFVAGMILIGASMLMLSSCGTYPTDVESSSDSSLNIRVWVDHSLAKTNQTTQTLWDSLVIMVRAADMPMVRHAVLFNPLQPYANCTIDNIAAGEDRLVEAWTCTKAGLRIHYASCTIAKVMAGQVQPVTLQLRPVCGSIYINLSQVPTTVDSVFAAFYFRTDSLLTKARRSALMYMSIDNVPDSTAGILVIRGTDATGRTMYCDSLSMVFYSTQNATLQAQFLAKPGGFAMNISLPLPGVTLVSGRMDATPSTASETGPLVISEIMYYSDGDSDYIEIYNPTAMAFSAPVLIVEIVNTSSLSTCRIENVTIPAGGRLVVGDTDAPSEWTDTVFAMDLSTTGRWITLKVDNGVIMDWVAYTKNEQEWPECTKSHSIELADGACDPLQNNFGRNWKMAGTSVAGIPDYYGTPGQ